MKDAITPPPVATLSDYQLDQLLIIARVSHQTLNCAAYDALKFAFDVRVWKKTRLVLRNSRKKQQRDLYIGPGVTLGYYVAPTKRAHSRPHLTPTTSFYLPRSSAMMFESLADCGFGLSAGATLSRSIHLYSEVLSYARSPGWKFGSIDRKGRFSQLRIRKAQEISVAIAIRGMRFVWSRVAIKRGALNFHEIELVRQFFACRKITDKIKLLEANKIVANDASLLPAVRELAGTFGLTLVQTEEIVAQRPRVWFAQKGVRT